MADSFATFKLQPFLQAALKDLGFQAPTPVQEKK